MQFYRESTRLDALCGPVRRILLFVKGVVAHGVGEDEMGPGRSA